MKDHAEVCSVSGTVMSPLGSTAICLITRQPSLSLHSCACTAKWILQFTFQPAHLRAGAIQGFHVSCRFLCRVGFASPPVVRHLRCVSCEHARLTTYLLVQASKPVWSQAPIHLWLVYVNDVYQRFTSVNPSTPP